MSMTMSKHGDENQEWTEAENKLQINFRAELAATLGGDFLLALDGPVLPTPSWKAVIEVNNSQLLEQTLEKLADALRSQTKGNNAHSIVIESADVSGQRFYSLQDTSTETTVAQYTFANGYMIVAPTRALIMEALQTYASGDSLAHSAAFRALLPKDTDENYSAIAYQNLTPVLTPLLSQLNGDSADALRQLAADARPTAICARGEQSSIEASSDSHLFGSEFLTLGNLIAHGNKNAAPRVRE
jgi:chaperone required for assembly of F1-ATPase